MVVGKWWVKANKASAFGTHSNEVDWNGEGEVALEL
jgi:hypothetical protein